VLIFEHGLGCIEKFVLKSSAGNFRSKVNNVAYASFRGTFYIFKRFSDKRFRNCAGSFVFRFCRLLSKYFTYSILSFRKNSGNGHNGIFVQKNPISASALHFWTGTFWCPVTSAEKVFIIFS